MDVQRRAFEDGGAKGILEYRTESFLACYAIEMLINVILPL